MSPPSSPAWLTAALELQCAGRLDEAEGLYIQALQRNPAEADALHLLGLIVASRGQLEDATRLIARAVAAKPSRADLRASLGNLFFARGMISVMAEHYRRALLLAYFSEVPAPFAEIVAHAGSDPGIADFPADADQYRSQYHQDVVLDRWLFGGLRGGTFADIGAHDGVTFSNSYFFEKTRGWRGVAIEPNPNAFALLAANRQCTVFNCCVSNETGTVPFLKISGYSEMLSGIVSHYDPEHRRRIEEELRRFGGSAEVIQIQTRSLNDIAAECGLAEITYLSIDTEGSELSILQSIDFGRLFVHALTVECNFEHVKTRMISLMLANGFDHVRTLGHDLLFLNRASPFHAEFNRLRGG